MEMKYEFLIARALNKAIKYDDAYKSYLIDYGRKEIYLSIPSFFFSHTNRFLKSIIHITDIPCYEAKECECWVRKFWQSNYKYKGKHKIFTHLKRK